MMPLENTSIFKGSVIAITVLFGLAAEPAVAQEPSAAERFRHSIPFKPSDVRRIAGQYEQFAFPKDKATAFAATLKQAADVLERGIEGCAENISAGTDGKDCAQKWKSLSEMVERRIPAESSALGLY